MKLRHLAVLLVGLGLGAGSLAIARSAPGGSLAGASTASAVALVGVGWALIACGVVAWARRPLSRFGVILVAAGAAWFVVESNNPGIGSPILFTIGLLVYAACPRSSPMRRSPTPAAAPAVAWNARGWWSLTRARSSCWGCSRRSRSIPRHRDARSARATS